jgi:hypothetical protein
MLQALASTFSDTSKASELSSCRARQSMKRFLSPPERNGSVKQGAVLNRESESSRAQVRRAGRNRHGSIRRSDSQDAN